MATRRPTSTPTMPPTAGPSGAPTHYVPEVPPEEIGDLSDPSSLSLHVILIMVSLILACIFVGYLSLHLARKYHPEWFRRGLRRKKEKKKESENGKEDEKKKTGDVQDKDKEKDTQSKSGKKMKLMSVKPITTEEENNLGQQEGTTLSKPKSISSIVPIRDEEAASEEISEATPVKQPVEEVVTSARSSRKLVRKLVRKLEVPDFLKDVESEMSELQQAAGAAPHNSLPIKENEAGALTNGEDVAAREGGDEVETGVVIQGNGTAIAAKEEPTQSPAVEGMEVVKSVDESPSGGGDVVEEEPAEEPVSSLSVKEIEDVEGVDETPSGGGDVVEEETSEGEGGDDAAAVAVEEPAPDLAEDGMEGVGDEEMGEGDGAAAIVAEEAAPVPAPAAAVEDMEAMENDAMADTAADIEMGIPEEVTDAVDNDPSPPSPASKKDTDDGLIDALEPRDIETGDSTTRE